MDATLTLDETPSNSKIFLDNNGLALFHVCLSVSMLLEEALIITAIFPVTTTVKLFHRYLALSKKDMNKFLFNLVGNSFSMPVAHRSYVPS